MNREQRTRNFAQQYITWFAVYFDVDHNLGRAVGFLRIPVTIRNLAGV